MSGLWRRVAPTARESYDIIIVEERSTRVGKSVKVFRSQRATIPAYAMAHSICSLMGVPLDFNDDRGALGVDAKQINAIWDRLRWDDLHPYLEYLLTDLAQEFATAVAVRS